MVNLVNVERTSCGCWLVLMELAEAKTNWLEADKNAAGWRLMRTLLDVESWFKDSVGSSPTWYSRH